VVDRIAERKTVKYKFNLTAWRSPTGPRASLRADDDGRQYERSAGLRPEPNGGDSIRSFRRQGDHIEAPTK